MVAFLDNVHVKALNLNNFSQLNQRGFAIHGDGGNKIKQDIIPKPTILVIFDKTTWFFNMCALGL